MNPLLERALVFLEEVYDPQRALFPSSTRLVDGRYVSIYDERGALRYSINCLLGLRQAARHGAGSTFAGEVDQLIQRFTERHYPRIRNHGDLGLLLVLLADRFEAGPAEDALRQIAEAAERKEAATLPLQDVSWMLWGTVALARQEVAGAAPVADRLFRALHRGFLDRDSLLPRYTSRLWRGNSVSFGPVVYFLRALYEYADYFEDEYAATLFRFGVARIQDIQGSQGEWPWLIDVKAGVPIDVYPVYSVHQDSMAMLFLLPALDLGLPGIRESIERSYAWVLGDNELSMPMILDEPFFRYRSLERRGGLQRPRRYAKTLPGVVLASRRFAGKAGGLRVNRECRSYEMGWVLFAWSGRQERLAVRRGGQPIQFGDRTSADPVAD
jgi:hypothetical protein